jgi:hypothetical protein
MRFETTVWDDSLMRGEELVRFEAMVRDDAMMEVKNW